MSEIACDHCGSEDVKVNIEPVRPHGPRMVATCGVCGTSWINTEPSLAEQITTAVIAARREAEDGYADLGPDENGDHHVVAEDEAIQHSASPRCGCNPDWLGENWIHHRFGADG